LNGMGAGRLEQTRCASITGCPNDEFMLNTGNEEIKTCYSIV